MNQTASTNTDSTARFIVAAVAVLVLLLGGFYIWVHRSQPVETTVAPLAIERTPVQPIEAPAVQTLATEAAPAEMPGPMAVPQRPIIPPPASLERSDDQVKLAFADLAPDMAKWMVADQQLRKWVLAIDLMADGDIPKQYRPLSIPVARFEPDIRGSEPDQQFFMKPDGFTRTDLVVKLFTAIDVTTLAQYYRAWLPMLEKVYQEQGKKDKFDLRLRAALQRVMDVKPLGMTAALAKRGGVIYVYADSRLEAASDVEKMMWRMGPDNSAKIQEYLKRVQSALADK